jgi:FkbM family methyltransferase
MRLGHRTGLISAYFSPSRNFPISLPHVFARGVLKRTCRQIGPEYVLGIEDRDDLDEVRLRDIRNPLFWPKAVPRHELYQSCSDCLCPTNWHHYEAPETTVDVGEGVVDCGAAEGIFALSVEGRAGRIGIFEPWEGFSRSLAATFGDRAAIRRQALGRSPRTAHLDGTSLYGVVNDAKGAQISIVTLDEFRAEFGPVNYIKADVEGSEHDLLEGAKETILADRPKIAMTVYHETNDWEQMLRQVRSVVPKYRYRIKGISYNGGKARPVMLHLWI